jgi:hypothetical protein
MRQIWEDIYSVGIIDASLGNDLSKIQAMIDNTALLPAFESNKIHGVCGVGNASGLNHKYNMMPMDDYPVFKENFNIVNKNFAVGNAMDNVRSYIPVSGSPEPVTIKLAWNAINLTFFLRLFMQDGALALETPAVNSGLEISKFIPYTSAIPVRYGIAVRFKQAAAGTDAVDQVMVGIICSKITIRGEEGGIIEGEVDLIPVGLLTLNMSNQLNNNTKAFDDTPVLKFEDTLVFLGKHSKGSVQLIGNQISIPSFELTLENNVKSQFFNWPNAQNITLGRFKASGSIPVPWNTANSEGLNQQIKDFKAGVDKTLTIVWGADKTNAANRNDMENGWINTTLGTAAGFGVDTNKTKAKNGLDNNYVSINLNIKYDDYDETDIDENPMNDMKFVSVQNDKNTFNVCTILTAYDKTKNSYVTT